MGWFAGSRAEGTPGLRLLHAWLLRPLAPLPHPLALTSAPRLWRAGIQRTQVQETVEVPREHVMYEKRTHHSLCKSYDYWEPTTQTRNEQESVTHTRYNADANAIAAYFTGVVEATTNSSVAAVRRYVRAYLADRVAEARAVLESMSARYVRVMEVALEAAQKGALGRQARTWESRRHPQPARRTVPCGSP